MGKLKLSQEILNVIYPVGSVYLTINDVNPQTLFGGTWVKCSGGFIYGSTGTGTSGDNGNGSGTSVSSSGSGNTGSTALSVSQMPSHNHTITVNSKSLTGNLNSMYGSSGVSPLRDNCRVDGVFSRNGTTTKNTPGYTAVKGYGLHIDASHSHSVSTNSSTTGGNSGNTTNTGSGKGHSHNIPYIAVYMWRRTK